jgi:CheY-specific phosphatase CheX
MNHPSNISTDSVTEWLIQAVQDVLETTFEQGGFPVELPDEALSPRESIVACIGIRGAFQLEAAIHFPVRLAARLASHSLGMPEAEIDDQMVDDVAGEFSNMVVGAVKSRVSDFDIACSMTVPRVLRCEASAADSERRIHGALAVIRGSAGPRSGSSANRLGFQVGDDSLRIDLHL